MKKMFIPILAAICALGLTHVETGSKAPDLTLISLRMR